MSVLFRRLAIIGFMGFGLLQITACDEIKRAADRCKSTSENGHTELNCN